MEMCRRSCAADSSCDAFPCLWISCPLICCIPLSDGAFPIIMRTCRLLVSRAPRRSLVGGRVRHSWLWCCWRPSLHGWMRSWPLHCQPSWHSRCMPILTVGVFVSCGPGCSVPGVAGFSLQVSILPLSLRGLSGSTCVQSFDAPILHWLEVLAHSQTDDVDSLGCRDAMFANSRGNGVGLLS